MSEAGPSALSLDELNTFFESLKMDRPPVQIDELAQDLVRGHIDTNAIHTRPGGFIPGPVMMAMADVVGWILVFTRVGITPMALTWDLSINFLRPAHGSDLMIESRQTKFGRLSHATHEFTMRAEPTKVVAHATTTYVVPDNR